MRTRLDAGAGLGEIPTVIAECPRTYDRVPSVTGTNERLPRWPSSQVFSCCRRGTRELRVRGGLGNVRASRLAASSPRATISRIQSLDASTEFPSLYTGRPLLSLSNGRWDPTAARHRRAANMTTLLVATLGMADWIRGRPIGIAAAGVGTSSGAR